MPVGLVDLAVSLVDLAVGLVDRVGTGALDVLAKTPGLYHVSELRYCVECRSAMVSTLATVDGRERGGIICESYARGLQPSGYKRAHDRQVVDSPS